jgi:hypothetical protein
MAPLSFSIESPANPHRQNDLPGNSSNSAGRSRTPPAPWKLLPCFRPRGPVGKPSPHLATLQRSRKQSHHHPRSSAVAKTSPLPGQPPQPPRLRSGLVATRSGRPSAPLNSRLAPPPARAASTPSSQHATPGQAPPARLPAAPASATAWHHPQLAAAPSRDPGSPPAAASPCRRATRGFAVGRFWSSSA